MHASAYTYIHTLFVYALYTYTVHIVLDILVGSRRSKDILVVGQPFSVCVNLKKDPNNTGPRANYYVPKIHFYTYIHYTPKGRSSYSHTYIHTYIT